MQVLQDNGYAAALNTSAWRRRPVIIQSFEITNLQWLASVSEIPLMQLLDESDYDTADELHKSYGDMMTDQGLADIAAYAQILGPWKESIMPTDGSGMPAPAHTFLNTPSIRIFALKPVSHLCWHLCWQQLHTLQAQHFIPG